MSLDILQSIMDTGNSKSKITDTGWYDVIEHFHNQIYPIEELFVKKKFLH